MDRGEVEGQYTAILTEQAWSIKILFYDQKITPKQRGQSRAGKIGRVANQNTGFASSCPLAVIPTSVKQFLQVVLTLKVFLSNVMSTNPIMSQMTHVKIEIRTTMGTKYADNLSANFWIGACKEDFNNSS